MGSSCLIQCRECFYMREFMIGIGMMYSPNITKDLDSEFALLPKLIKSKEVLAYIRELLEEKKAHIPFGYGHRVYRCPKCGVFHGRFYLRLEYDGGSYEVPYHCPECKVSLGLVNFGTSGSDYLDKEKAIDIEQYPCPSCGKHSLQYSEGMILWD